MHEETYTASAPGKIILMGEHAVVYGRPAIAVPVRQVQAAATLRIDGRAADLWVDAVDVQRRYALSTAPVDDPLAACVRGAAEALQRPLPAGELTVRSTIPVAGGLGSGAAVSTAIVRVLAAQAAASLPPQAVSALVFEVERLYHGTPSGIDNTVIAHERPVWFVRGNAPTPFALPYPFWIVIANLGLVSPTRETVGDVRRGWLADTPRYEARFERIGSLVLEARDALLAGAWPVLGRLMCDNHRLLQELDVSSSRLDTLVDAAVTAGAWGAKLSGGGRGGNIIALIDPDMAGPVMAALRAAGARSLILTQVM